MTTPNDIPVAQRVSNTPTERRSAVNALGRSLRSVPWWGYSLAIFAFFLPVVGSRFLFGAAEPSNANIASKASTSVKSTNTSDTTSTNVAGLPSTQPSNQLSSQSNTQKDSQPATENILGHLPYEEAPANSLRNIGRAYDGYEIKLRSNAAKSYLEMVAAARANGIDLVPISGFRTRAEQEKLFFDIGKQRNQTPAERAMVSAPPGYSEHHTGYAVDVGDGANPSTNLSPAFDKTPAFLWLQQNAAQFGFELSFPPNNPQGVMYEPWHWRYVGDNDSLATFYKSQQLTRKSSTR